MSAARLRPPSRGGQNPVLLSPYLAPLTCVDPVVEARGLVPAHPALHVEAAPRGSITAHLQLVQQGGRRGILGEVCGYRTGRQLNSRLPGLRGRRRRSCSPELSYPGLCDLGSSFERPVSSSKQEKDPSHVTYADQHPSPQPASHRPSSSTPGLFLGPHSGHSRRLRQQRHHGRLSL